MLEAPHSCIEEKSFRKCKEKLLRELSLTNEEFDTAYIFPIEDLIIFNPSIYPSLPGTELHIVATNNTSRFPSIRVAYTFSDGMIHLWYADLNPAIS
jgi:hypothetical protein